MAGGVQKHPHHDIPGWVWVVLALFFLFVVVPILHSNGIYLQGQP